MINYRMVAIVQMAVESELRKRRKLEDVDTVEDVVKLIQESKNIMILAGAGSISLSSTCLYLLYLYYLSCFCIFEICILEYLCCFYVG